MYSIIKAQGPGASYCQVGNMMLDPRDERNHMLLSAEQEAAYQQAVAFAKNGDMDSAKQVLSSVFTTIRVEHD